MSFTGDLSTGYRANLWLRSAIRVLLLLAETLLDARQPAGEEVRWALLAVGGGVAAAADEMCVLFSMHLRTSTCTPLALNLSTHHPHAAGLRCL